MSLDLRDIRSKVSPDTDVTIEAFAEANGLDKSEAVRVILDKWARKQIHDATVLVQMLKRSGSAGEVRGIAGKGTRIVGDAE
jgi:hypothetical protein